MKKIIIIIIGILFITGCQSEKLTPTSIVEAYLSKYQNLDKSVLKDLEMSLEDERAKIQVIKVIGENKVQVNI